MWEAAVSIQMPGQLTMGDNAMVASVSDIQVRAQAEILDIAKLYGPGGFNGPGGPPPELLVAIQKLETATTDDPGLIQSTDDALVSLETSIQNELRAMAQAVGDSGRIALLGDVANFAAQSKILEQNAPSFTPITSPPYTVVQPPAPPADGSEQYLISNMSTGITDWETGQKYSGPVANLTNQFVTTTPDNLNITATKPNNFIHTGAGTDAIDVEYFGEAGAGTNVLDGGAGSNFLVGCSVLSSRDTFFVDDRGATSDIASTIVNFHAGDVATVFGVNATSFTRTMADNFGAPGFTGLTIGFSAAGHPNANFVLAGYSSADILSGRLTMTFGRTADLPGLPGSDYMMIVAH